MNYLNLSWVTSRNRSRSQRSRTSPSSRFSALSKRRRLTTPRSFSPASTSRENRCGCRHSGGAHKKSFSGSTQTCLPKPLPRSWVGRSFLKKSAAGSGRQSWPSVARETPEHLNKPSRFAKNLKEHLLGQL